MIYYYFFLIVLIQFPHKFIETAPMECPREKEKNPLESDGTAGPSDSNRPNIFIDRNNLLGKAQAQAGQQMFSYQYGNTPLGPSHWPKLFKTCGGKHQSPIDINLSTLKNIHMPKISWDATYNIMPEMITIENTGYTIEVKVKYPNNTRAKIQGGPMSSAYALETVHFHWGSTDHKGSEHLINGKSFPMEMHAVHVKEHTTLEQASKLADGVVVVAYIFEEKEVKEFVEKEFKEENYKDEEKKTKAKKDDTRCKSYIVQCLDDAQIDLVRNQETTYSMWKSLEERYEKKGVPGQMLLRKKLMNMKLKEAKDLEIFLSEFDEVTRQLKVTGAELKKEDIVCTLLLAMPPFFETIISIIENMSEADLTVELVKAKLRSELERWEVLNEKNENIKPAAFSLHRVGVCYVCGESGHYKKDCKKLLQNQQTRETGSTNFQRGFNRSTHRTQRGGYNRARGSRGNRRSGFDRRGNYAENQRIQSDTEEQGICFMTSSENKEYHIEDTCHMPIKYIQESFDLVEMDLHTAQPLQNMFPISELVEPFCCGYVTYKGSMTTPPCAEAATWIMSPYTVGLSKLQLQNFRKLYDSCKNLENNFRPVQPLNGRTVHFVN